MGVSSTHSSAVGNIMNLRTGNVSPQYHVVYDDLFSTVPNGETGGILDDMPFNQLSWSNILEPGWEREIDPVHEASSGTRFVPSLDCEWLSDEELPPSVAQPVDTSILPEPPRVAPNLRKMPFPLLFAIKTLFLQSHQRVQHLPQREKSTQILC
jgi:hypothetical protein